MKEMLKNLYGRFFFIIFKLLPLQNKVVFSCFSGKRYADNPKCISSKCHELYPEVKQVWLQHKDYNFVVPEYIKVVKWPSIEMIYELATAKIWVDSHTKPTWVIKRKKQFYIETWHGGLGMKKIEGDVKEKLPKKTIIRSKHNSKMVDLLISDSTWLTEIYKRAFWYNGKILESGYPKNDILFNKSKHADIRNKINEIYNIEKNKLIILYAPTFREDAGNTKYGIELEKIYNEISKQQECVVMFRLHPLLMKEKIFYEKEDKIINATEYDDMQELIIAADILITDYSSCIFDFAMLKKPAFIFANDIEKYEGERGLYFDIKELPFPFATNTDELIHNIKNFENDEYEKEIEQYFIKVGLKDDGNATEKIVKIINDIIYNKNN